MRQSMKRYLWIALIGCMVLMGCQQGIDESTEPEMSTPEVTTEMETDGEDVKESESADVTVEVPGTLEWGPPLFATGEQETLSGEAVEIYAQGMARITYVGNQNYVRYITSPDALAHYGIDGLKQYDESFFEKKALVLVCETVNSGSVRVSIDQIIGQDTQMTVLLSREMPGDAGTADMATWLIWAEVDAGWDEYSWVLANPMLKSEMQTS